MKTLRQSTSHSALPARVAICFLLLLISLMGVVRPTLGQVNLPSSTNASNSNFATSVPNLADVIPGPIRKGDVLRVVIANLETLGGDFRVDVDGSIIVPRIGQLTLFEKMPIEAARSIGKQIVRRGLLRTPSVAVYIVGRKAREVLVNGAVTAQGRQTIKDNTLLAEVLEQATPITTADLSRVAITRADGSEVKIDYKQYRNGVSNAAEYNPVLEDGDRVYVFSSVPPEGTVRLTGEVKDSTKVLMPILQGATAGQVLQMAGGVTDYADRENILLVRNGERIPIKYNDILKAKPDTDPVLKDRDEIVVPRLERRRQFTVAGAVRDARTFPLNSQTTLLEAVGDAGGPLDGAQQNRVEVRRKNASGQIVSYIKDLKMDKDATTPVQDGDYIFLPYGKRRPTVDLISVAGLVSAVAITLGQLRR